MTATRKTARRRRPSDFRVYLRDEAPSIGCGWRGIDLVKLGHKWVRLRETATGRSARISLAQWTALRPVPWGAAP